MGGGAGLTYDWGIYVSGGTICAILAFPLVPDDGKNFAGLGMSWMVGRIRKRDLHHLYIVRAPKTIDKTIAMTDNNIKVTRAVMRAGVR